MKALQNIQIAIIGSRTFTNYELFKFKCDSILRNLESFTIISGGARGTDSLTERYASEKNIPIRVYKANWNQDGRSAGMMRNIIMLNACTHVIAFWDGKSTGTAHMISQAQSHNKYLRIIIV